MKCIAIALGLVLHLVAQAQVQIRQIRPSDTDPAISTFNTDSNYVYIDPSVNALGLLLVHLPGTAGEPKRATLFGSHAATLGYHSIGLMYPNIPTVGSYCSNNPDVNCFEDVRLEIIDGTNHSSELAIAPQECILHRLKKLLIYLHAQYPSENWGQYLDASQEFVFSKIVFSGHSQGGGHAAVIAKHYPIKRALCFSSPKDWENLPNQPATWLYSGNWLTNSDQIFCFNHTDDDHAQQLIIWDSLGIGAFGSPVLVDLVVSPYNNTHQLETSYGVPAADAHACTIQDNKTPKVSGIPVFLPVWTYMLSNGITTQIDEINAFEKISVFPNPTKGSVQLSIPVSNATLRLYDANGKLVHTEVINSQTSIDLKELNNGLYFLSVESEKKWYSSTILLNHP